MTTQTKIGIGLFASILVIAGIISSISPKPSGNKTIPKLPNSSNPAVISFGSSSSLPILADAMPPFAGITHWWNTPNNAPLTPADLRGKVVLVDFWTYSCINCIRTYPFLKSIWAKYADKGLVIIGVHTPEFAFEKEPTNISAEITKNGLMYPIALDPDYGTWNAYANNSWPAEYLFDRQGRLRNVHLGEGDYDQSETDIRQLLEADSSVQLGAAGNQGSMPDFSKIKTGETYFGLARGSAFMGIPGSAGVDTSYNPVREPNIDANKWLAGGTWKFENEYIETRSSNDLFRFSVQASKMHIVMASSDGTDKTIEVFVDGVKTRDLTINQSTLYTIAEFPDAGRHTVEIRVHDAGVQFYAATFS